MNIVFSSDKKEYNTIKKGTEILLAENDGFNQNIELFVKFQDRPEILINKRKDQIHIICREISHYYRALNYALLPGLVLFAHLDFHRDYDETILKQEFRNCTGGEFDDFMTLDNFDSLFLNTKENKEAQNPSKYLLYQDPMLGIFDYHVKESGVNTKSYYQNIQKCMKECAKKTGKYQLLFSFYEKLAAVLADKADLGMCIKSAYDRSDRAALKDISQNVIPGIICNLTDMKSSREKIWMNDAKPFGYEILDIKIGGVITRLKSTGYRIDNYLNGNVLRLEELEEERLPYFTKGMDKRENLWNRIISGCDLNDTI